MRVGRGGYNHGEQGFPECGFGRSVAALRSDYEYAVLDDELFALMTDITSRERIVALLAGMV